MSIRRERLQVRLTSVETDEAAGTWSASFDVIEPASSVAAVVIAGGRPVPVRSCATCFDQPAPPAECPSCRGSGDPCRPGITAGRKA